MQKFLWKTEDDATHANSDPQRVSSPRDVPAVGDLVERSRRRRKSSSMSRGSGNPSASSMNDTTSRVCCLGLTGERPPL